VVIVINHGDSLNLIDLLSDTRWQQFQAHAPIFEAQYPATQKVIVACNVFQ
jgi:hypothetical protein